MNKKPIFPGLIVGLILGLFSSAAFSQDVGDRVLARWQADGYWYPGEVDYVDRRGFHIVFDDEDEAVVGPQEIRQIFWRAGTRLECNWKDEGEYFPGRITSMRGEGIDFLYDDGYRERITISSCRSR